MQDNGLMIGGELVLYGFVGDDFMGEGFTARAVLEALAEADGDVTVRLNSGGGFAWEGVAIHSALMAHPGRVTVRVDGVAASAASVIAMAADELVMATGAMLMIHDPRNISMGTAEDHRREAAMLDRLAGQAAAIYAGRSGRGEDEIRALMAAETWLTGEEAAEMGFADRAGEGEAATASAFDYRAYKNSPAALVRASERMGWAFGQPEGREGPAPRERAVAPITTEALMVTQSTAAAHSEAAENIETPAAVQAVEAAPEMRAEPRPDPVADRRAAVLGRFGERMTARQVEDVAVAARDTADALVRAADIVIEAQMAAAGPETREPARIVSDERERNADAMISALQHTMFGSGLEGAATQYRGLTFKKLAVDLSGRRGYSWNDSDLVRAGMSAQGVLMAAGHSTSDFSYITTEVINRQLRAAYDSRPGTWGAISRQRTATDFRSLYSVQAGVDTEMKKIAEDGEYQGTVLTDGGETLKVERYGRKVLLTFEAVINDDLGAFARLPQDFARGARNLESRIVWGIINANGNLSDGTALFATAAARKNLASSGGAISVTTIGAARKAMWEQRPMGAKATGDDFISAVPDMLYVPPALELTALQFAAATSPDTDGNTNPYKATLTPMVEPRLGAAVTGGSDAAWYLFDSSLPVIEHAYLSGYEAPMVEAMDRMDPDGVTLIARHIFGAGAVEFRGAYKNPGS